MWYEAIYWKQLWGSSPFCWHKTFHMWSTHLTRSWSVYFIWVFHIFHKSNPGTCSASPGSQGGWVGRLCPVLPRQRRETRSAWIPTLWWGYPQVHVCNNVHTHIIKRKIDENLWQIMRCSGHAVLPPGSWSYPFRCIHCCLRMEL